MKSVFRFEGDEFELYCLASTLLLCGDRAVLAQGQNGLPRKRRHPLRNRDDGDSLCGRQTLGHTPRAAAIPEFFLD